MTRPYNYSEETNGRAETERHLKAIRRKKEMKQEEKNKLCTERKAYCLGCPLVDCGARE